MLLSRVRNYGRINLLYADIVLLSQTVFVFIILYFECTEEEKIYNNNRRRQVMAVTLLVRKMCMPPAIVDTAYDGRAFIDN